MKEPTQLQIDYAALTNKYLGQNYTRQVYEAFWYEFGDLLSRHHLHELRYSAKRPEPGMDRQTLVIVQMTAASEIVLLYMMGVL
jgi:hypothetical protein